jgi:hypothetical protein
MDNAETLATLSTQETRQINLRENRMDNQEWTIHRHCQHWLQKMIFSNIYLSFVLCTQCWQYLWIIHSWSLPPFSLTFTWPVSFVINVDSAYGLSILDCPFGFLLSLFVLFLVYSMLTVPLDCPFLIAHSVFSKMYLSCVLCTQCWQYLWIIHSWSPPRFSLTSTWPVSCVFNVDSVSALSILDCPFGFL